MVALLAFLAFIPGALAHHCTPDESQNPDDFSVQTVAPPVPVVVGGLVLLPVVIAGIVAAAVHASGKAAASAVSGRWVWTPDQWVFVRDK
jgi:hypothetical protein